MHIPFVPGDTGIQIILQALSGISPADAKFLSTLRFISRLLPSFQYVTNTGEDPGNEAGIFHNFMDRVVSQWH